MPRNTKGIEVAEIIQDQCIGCQICVAECPVGAIEITPEGVAHINPELCVGCGKCAEVCPVRAVRFEKKRLKRKVRLPKEAAPEHRGVGVFVEVFGGTGAQVSWELMGKARELCTKLNTELIGFLLGYQVNGISREAVAYCCDEVHVIDHPLLQHYLPETYGKALAQLCQEVKPEILLMGATALGRALSGVVATHLGTGLTADCTGLGIEDDSGLLLMTRPAFGGNIMATIFCESHRPQMSTVRPRVFRKPAKDIGREGKVHHHSYAPPEDHLPQVVDFILEKLDAAGITNAPALVVAGKGACAPSSMPMLQELADLVGGVVACSRPVVEAGLMPYERQVGLTGKTVAPKLYIGIGVSGAVQHLVGMQGSEKIVAINSDPNALIFNIADVGLVGDYLDVVPALIAGLKRRLERE
jgi:electron transfer flavoprotein alpha subunit